MHTGEMKFVNWRRVDLKKPTRRNKRANKVWLTKHMVHDNPSVYQRLVHIDTRLLSAVGWDAGTELILVRSGKLYGFKKVNAKGQFKLNKNLVVQNQPLYLELKSHIKDSNMEFDAFVHDEMIIFHEPTKSKGEEDEEL